MYLRLFLRLFAIYFILVYVPPADSHNSHSNWTLLSHFSLSLFLVSLSLSLSPHSLSLLLLLVTTTCCFIYNNNNNSLWLNLMCFGSARECFAFSIYLFYIIGCKILFHTMKNSKSVLQQFNSMWLDVLSF